MLPVTTPCRKALRRVLHDVERGVAVHRDVPARRLPRHRPRASRRCPSTCASPVDAFDDRRAPALASRGRLAFRASTIRGSGAAERAASATRRPASPLPRPGFLSSLADFRLGLRVLRRRGVAAGDGGGRRVRSRAFASVSGLVRRRERLLGLWRFAKALVLRGQATTSGHQDLRGRAECGRRCGSPVGALEEASTKDTPVPALTAAIPEHEASSSGLPCRAQARLEDAAPFPCSIASGAVSVQKPPQSTPSSQGLLAIVASVVAHRVVGDRRVGIAEGAEAGATAVDALLVVVLDAVGASSARLRA